MAAKGTFRPGHGRSSHELARTHFTTPARVCHRVHCGKAICRYATGEGHGPYWFLH